MLNKILLVVSCLFLNLAELQAQSGFVFKYSSPSDEFPTSIVETSDHGFIVSADIGTYPNSYQILLLRLNMNGDTISSKKIVVSSGYSYISNILKLTDGSFLGIGQKIFSSGEIKLWLINFTDSLEVLKDTSYFINLQTIFFISGFINYQQDVIIYGYGVQHSALTFHPFVLTVNQNLDSLGFVSYTTTNSSQYVYSMVEKPDTSGYLMMIFGKYIQQTYSPSQILSMDDSFNITQVDSIPRDLDLYLNSKYINQNRLLVTGKQTNNSSPRTDHLAILNLDSTFQVKNEYYLGPEDTICYPAAYKNLDFTDPNIIYYGGTINFDVGAIFSNKLSFLMLGRFDSILNLNWKNTFGGDQYYIAYTLTALEEGGCIIGASSYNYLTQNQERDIYIIKVDSNGIITSVYNESDFKNPFVVFPNPAKDVLSIYSTSKNAELILFDVCGKKILRKEIGEGLNAINVSNLLPGLYLYQLKDKNLQVSKGKWIKD